MIPILLALALSVTLTWTDNSDNEDGFRMYRQLTGATFQELTTVGPNVATVTDAAAVAGACYKVTAYNLSGESLPSNTVCLPLLPQSPTSLQARKVN